MKPGLEHLVRRLKKLLFGLKQSPRCWNKVFQQYTKLARFTECPADHCVYVRQDKTLSIVAVQVDDLIIIAENQTEMDKIKMDLARRFGMKDMGILQCLGVNLIYNEKLGCMQLHQ